MRISSAFKTVLSAGVCCIAIFAFVTGTQSCNKEKADTTKQQPVPRPDIDHIRKCHNKENPYPSQINANLQGTWVWQSYTCYGAKEQTLSAGKIVVLTFSDGGLYKVYENSAVIEEGSWTLTQNSAGDNWTITTTNPSAYLGGYIVLCKNEVIFSSSYKDGCDYYFTSRG